MSKQQTHSAPAPRILVTGAGGPAGYGFMRALGESWPGAQLYAVDASPLAAGLQFVRPERRAVVPMGAAPDFAEHMMQLCRRWDIDVLVPTVDTELVPLSVCASRLAAAGTRVLCSSPLVLRRCLDKFALLRSLRGVVPVAKFELLRAQTDIGSWSFPCIAKPRSGSGSRGVKLVHSEEGLHDIPRDGTYLLMEYLPGEEYSVDVFRTTAGDVVGSVPRVRMRVDSGVAVTARTVHDPLLELFGVRVAEHLGVWGAVNVQFKRDLCGIPSILEINPRYPGTMPLTVRAGVNMPLLGVLDALELEVPSKRLPFEEVAVVRTWQEHFVSPSSLGTTDVLTPTKVA